MRMRGGRGLERFVVTCPAYKIRRLEYLAEQAKGERDRAAEAARVLASCAK